MPGRQLSVILKIGLVALPATIDAKDINRVSATSNAIVTRRRYPSDDGVDVSGRSDGRPFRSYMAFQFVKLVKGFRRKKLALRQAASPALMTAQFYRT